MDDTKNKNRRKAENRKDESWKNELDKLGKEIGELDPEKDRDAIRAKEYEICLVYRDHHSYFKGLLIKECGKIGIKYQPDDNDTDEIFTILYLEMREKFDSTRGKLSDFFISRFPLRLRDYFRKEFGTAPKTKEEIEEKPYSKTKYTRTKVSLDTVQDKLGSDTGAADQKDNDAKDQGVKTANVADNIFFELSASILNFQKTGNRKSHNEKYRKYCTMFYTGHLQGTLREEWLHANKIYEHFRHPREILEQANTDLLNYFTAQEIPYGNRGTDPALNPVSLEKIALNPLKKYREVLSPELLKEKKRGLDEETKLPIPNPAYCGYYYHSEGKEITEQRINTQHARFKEEFLLPLKTDREPLS